MRNFQVERNQTVVLAIVSALIVARAIAYFLFGEMPGIMALAGMVLVLASVALAVLASRRRA